MTRMKTKVIGAVAGAAIACLSVSSCVANDGSIIIIGMMSPPIATGTGGSAVCTYTPNIIGPFLSYGTMDVAFAQGGYVAVLLLGNQLVAQGNAALDRAESNNVNLTGAIVRVTDATGAELDNYTVPGAGFLLPSSGGTPGLGTYATTLVSPKAADAARQSLGISFGTKRLISYIKVFGTTSGGTHIESGEIAIPVNACNGCLVTFPAGSDDPAQAQPNCALSASSGSSSTITEPCVFGQDQTIDCRLCQGNVACDPAAR